MTFEDALTKLNENKNILGKVLDGARIDELLITPTDFEHFKEFELRYCKTLDAQNAIAPYINEDVDILVIFNKDYMFKIGLWTVCTLDYALSRIK